MNLYFFADLLSDIDENLIAASEAAKKSTAKSSIHTRTRVYFIAAAIVMVMLATIATVIAFQRENGSNPGGIPEESQSNEESQSSLPNPNDYFVIENGILLSYTGKESEIFIPEGVVTLSADAFVNAKSLKIIHLSKTLETVEEKCLSNCESLEEVHAAENGNLTEVGGMIFSMDGTKIIYVNKTEKLPEVLIFPEGLEVIPDFAFSGRDELKKIVFPQSMRTIGEYSFQMCSSLTEVEFGGTRAVEDSAFRLCIALKKLTFHDVITIYEDAFYLSPISEVDFGNRLRQVQINAFRGNEMTEVTFPETLKTLYQLSFYGSIQTVFFEGAPYQWEKVEVAGNAFGPSSTNQVEIVCLKENPEENPLQYYSNGNGTCSVGPSASRLNSGVIEIPQKSPAGDDVTAIKDFRDCVNITKVILPEKIQSLPNYAFAGCINLESIEMPGVQRLGISSFHGCEKLTSVVLPDALTVIPESAFQACRSLENINWPSDLRIIRKTAFSECDSFTSITVPQTVTTIGECAFSYCRNLVSVDMSKMTVTSFGFGVFSECHALTDVALPPTLRELERGMFANSAIETITIPDSVVVCHLNMMPRLKTVQFGANVTTLTMTDSTAIESITIPSTVTEIGIEAFKNCTSLRTVIIPDTVTAIHKVAFQNCTALASITIPNSVTSIGMRAFEDCKALASVTIPYSVTAIDEKAFLNCTALETAILQSPVAGTQMFEGCSRLKTLTLSQNLKEIPIFAFRKITSLETLICESSILTEYMFEGCSNLTSVSLSPTLQEIPMQAFYGCSALKTIVLPDSLTTLGKSAFGNCTNLESVTISYGIRSISQMPFHGCSSLQTIYYEGSRDMWNILFKPDSNIPSNVTVVCRDHVVYPEGFTKGIAEITISEDVVFAELDASFRPTEGTHEFILEKENNIAYRVAYSETHSIVYHCSQKDQTFYYCMIPNSAILIIDE